MAGLLPDYLPMYGRGWVVGFFPCNDSEILVQYKFEMGMHLIFRLLWFFGAWAEGFGNR